MRENPEYALTDAERVRDLVRENPWCTIVSFVPERGLVASHCPVLLDEDADDIVLLSHVGRPDDEKHELGRHEMLVIVQSTAHGYVSPSWYRVPEAVPTWNFTVAHAYGTPELLTHEENLGVLDRLVERFERAMPHPHLMRGTPANAEYADRVARGAAGFRVRVARFEAKDKMSQDKTIAVAGRVIAALEEPGAYQRADLAAHMRTIHEKEER